MEFLVTTSPLKPISTDSLKDPAYYTPANVRNDLENFASNCGKGISVSNFRQIHIDRVQITCCNGERLGGASYLRYAAVAFGFTKKWDDADPFADAVLAKLMKIGGYENIYDADYYTEKHVKADLDAFTKALGIGKVPQDLTSQNLPALRITTDSGQKVTGNQYVAAASVVFGFSKSLGGVRYHGSLSRALQRLFEIAGYVSSKDAEYFLQKNVKADLDLMAAQCGLSPSELTTSDMKKVTIKMSNGEEISGLNYLSNAAVALGVAKDQREAIAMYHTTLSLLMSIAGYMSIRYHDQYFFEPNNVRADLAEFARQIPGGNVATMRPYQIVPLSIVSQSGEHVSGVQYLNRAAVAFGFAKNAGAADSQRIKTLDKLRSL